MRARVQGVRVVGPGGVRPHHARSGHASSQDHQVSQVAKENVQKAEAVAFVFSGIAGRPRMEMRKSVSSAAAS